MKTRDAGRCAVQVHVSELEARLLTEGSAYIVVRPLTALPAAAGLEGVWPVEGGRPVDTAKGHQLVDAAQDITSLRHTAHGLLMIIDALIDQYGAAKMDQTRYGAELRKLEGRAMLAEAERAAIKEAHDELVAKLERGACPSCEALEDRAEAYMSELDELRALTLAQGKAIETAFALRDEAVRERDEARAALAGGER